MVERKFFMCEICTREFEGNQAHAHVEVFLNSIKIRNSGYVDQHYSDIARLGMCYDCLQEGLKAWKLHKLQEVVLDLQSGGKVLREEQQKL